MVACNLAFPALTNALNSGSSPLKDSTVALLDSMYINDYMDNNDPCAPPDTCSSTCYTRKTNGQNHFNGTTGYYTTGHCQIEILANSYKPGGCNGASICGSTAVVLEDLALVIDNLFALVDYSFSHIIKGILNTTFTATGALATSPSGATSISTSSELGDVIGNLTYYPANTVINTVMGNQTSPLIRSMPIEDNSYSNNSGISIDLNTLKALFGVHA